MTSPRDEPIDPDNPFLTTERAGTDMGSSFAVADPFADPFAAALPPAPTAAAPNAPGTQPRGAATAPASSNQSPTPWYATSGSVATPDPMPQSPMPPVANNSAHTIQNPPAPFATPAPIPFAPDPFADIHQLPDASTAYAAGNAFSARGFSVGAPEAPEAQEAPKTGGTYPEHTATPSPSAPYMLPVKSTTSIKDKLPLLYIVFGLVVLGVAAYFFFSSDKSSPVADPTPTTTASAASTTTTTLPSSVTFAPGSPESLSVRFAESYMSFDGSQGMKVWRDSFRASATQELNDAIQQNYADFMTGDISRSIYRAVITDVTQKEGTSDVFIVTADSYRFKLDMTSLSKEQRVLQLTLRNVNNNLKIALVEELDPQTGEIKTA